jgi:hypothetical protein
MFKYFKFVVGILTAMLLVLSINTSIFAEDPALSSNDLDKQYGLTASEYKAFLEQEQVYNKSNIAKLIPAKYAEDQDKLFELCNNDPQTARQMYPRFFGADNFGLESKTAKWLPPIILKPTLQVQV